MKLWRRRHSGGDAEQEGADVVTSEATRARQQAERDLESTKRELIVTRSQTRHFADLGDTLRELRMVNHIREDVETALLGRRRG
jgi:hypothetical protein